MQAGCCCMSKCGVDRRTPCCLPPPPPTRDPPGLCCTHRLMGVTPSESMPVCGLYSFCFTMPVSTTYTTPSTASRDRLGLVGKPTGEEQLRATHQARVVCSTVCSTMPLATTWLQVYLHPLQEVTQQEGATVNRTSRQCRGVAARMTAAALAQQAWGWGVGKQHRQHQGNTKAMCYRGSRWPCRIHRPTWGGHKHTTNSATPPAQPPPTAQPLQQPPTHPSPTSLQCWLLQCSGGRPRAGARRHVPVGSRRGACLAWDVACDRGRARQAAPAWRAPLVACALRSCAGNLRPSLTRRPARMICSWHYPFDSLPRQPWPSPLAELLPPVPASQGAAPHRSAAPSNCRTRPVAATALHGGRGKGAGQVQSINQGCRRGAGGGSAGLLVKLRNYNRSQIVSGV